MVTLLLADTDPKISKIVHKVENMCHAVGIGVIVHHEGEDLDEILDSVDAKIIAFSPLGHLTLDEMVHKYWAKNILLVVGGFTEGDFKSKVYPRADDTVSLGPKLLPIPIVIEQIINTYEKKAKRPLRKAGER
jgi:rRNA pseudouridine-1189 N-methylase Emg1 (Nep1/Mra1 family)